MEITDSLQPIRMWAKAILTVLNPNPNNPTSPATAILAINGCR